MLKKRFFAVLLVGLPLLALCLPLLQMTLHFAPDFSVNENRVLQPRPTLAQAKADYAKFRANVESHFNDHFGFRSYLLLFNSVLKYEAFDVAVNPRVAIGKEGWLYLQDFRADIRQTRPMSDEELRFWHKELERREQWAAAGNSQYFFVIAPNKSSIYPQYLPDELGPVGNESRTDQLLAYLRQHSLIKVIDTRPALRAAAGLAQSYYRKDLHWNNFGGFAGTQVLLQAMAAHQPRVTPFRQGEYHLQRQTKTRYPDLAGLLSLQSYLGFDDEVDVEVVSDRLKWGQGSFRLPPGYNTRVAQSGSQPASAVLFSDSFGIALFEYLSQRLGRVYAVESGDMPFFPEIVEKEAPAFVVDLILEGKLSFMPAVPAADFDQRANAYWQQAFTDSPAGRDERPVAGAATGAVWRATVPLSDEATCHIGQFQVRATVPRQVRISIVTRRAEGQGKTQALKRALRPGDNALFIPLCGRQQAQVVFVGNGQQAAPPAVRLLAVRPWAVERIDKSKILDDFAGVWADRWSTQVFGWQPQFSFKHLVLSFHVDAHTLPNSLSVSTPTGRHEYPLEGGLNRLELPYATHYQFRLARTFVPKVVGVGEDSRTLGVIFETAETR